MAMPRRGERDQHKERFWRRLIGQWRRSGLTARDFCAERGVSEPSFYAWRRTIRQRDQQGRRQPRRNDAGRTGTKPVFVPVQVVPAAPAAVAGALELVLGQGRVVRVPPGFDAPTLRQLLTLLEEPSC
jgi:transposase-like protein